MIIKFNLKISLRESFEFFNYNKMKMIYYRYNLIFKIICINFRTLDNHRTFWLPITNLAPDIPDFIFTMQAVRVISVDISNRSLLP